MMSGSFVLKTAFTQMERLTGSQRRLILQLQTSFSLHPEPKTESSRTPAFIAFYLFITNQRILQLKDCTVSDILLNLC